MQHGDNKYPLRGVLAMIAACTVWGLSALYYRLIVHVPPLEVLGHRTLWSLVFLFALLVVRGRVAELLGMFRSRRMLTMVALAGLLISINWAVFIFSVQIGKLMESSLGYYIFPLVAVVLGLVVQGEQPSKWQGIAVGLATLAVVVLTLGLGVAPWISLILALTFGLYGLIKARLGADAVVGVAAEVLILAPLALVWLWGVHTQGWTGVAEREGGFFGLNRDGVLLMLSGLLTGLPLVMMGYALRNLRLSTVGLVQYLNPTLQFATAFVLFSEPFTRWHGIAFALIWTGLAIYSWDSVRQDRRARKSRIKS